MIGIFGNDDLSFKENITNIYKIADDAYPSILVDRATNWKQEEHNFRARIYLALKEKYPLLFDDGIPLESKIKVKHRKDFDTLEYYFNGPFKKQIEELYPEALI